MHKLDSGAAVGETIGFVFKRFGTVVRVAWAPILLQIATLLVLGLLFGTVTRPVDRAGRSDLAALAADFTTPTNTLSRSISAGATLGYDAARSGDPAAAFAARAGAVPALPYAHAYVAGRSLLGLGAEKTPDRAEPDTSGTWSRAGESGPGDSGADGAGVEVSYQIFNFSLSGVEGLQNLVGLIIFAMIAVPLQRLIILGEEPVGVNHIRLDGLRLRYMLVTFVINLLLLVAMFAVFALSAVLFLPDNPQDVYGQLKPGEDPSAEVAAAIFRIVSGVFLIGIPVLAYLSIKLMMAPPVTACENRIALFDTFGTTWGNAWRIFGAALMLFALLLGIMFFALLLISAIVPVASGVGGDALNAVSLVVLIAVALALNYIAFTAQIAFPAICYRRITQGNDEDLDQDPGMPLRASFFKSVIE